MCTKPIEIINPKLKSKHSSFNAGTDPVILRVPCGQCRQCQKHKQQDILVRLAYEYEYTKKQGGFVLFQTMTYREEDVPEWHGLKVFNRYHITEFIKKLRVYLTRNYEERVAELNEPDNLLHEAYFYQIDYKPQDDLYEEQKDFKAQELTGDIYEFDITFNKKWPTHPNMHPRGKLKVFIVSEYGGEFGRPHYHILFFVTFDIEPRRFNELFKKAWIWGFTDKRHISKLIVQDFSAISYVSKYVCKDIEWVKTITKQKNSAFMPYFQKRWEQLYEEPFNYEKFSKMPCETIKKLMHDIGMDDAIPFNTWSQGLGLYALNKIEEQDLQKGTMTVRDKNKAWIRCQIPQYLKRKIYYDYDKMIKYWQLNEKGKIRKANQVEHTIQRTIINCDIIFKQTKVDGINNDYKERLYELVYNDMHLYNELITTLVHRDKLITHEFEQLLKSNHTWEEITMEEYMNGIENVSLTSKHEPHTWIYYQLKYNKNTYLRKVTGTNEQVVKLIEIYDKGWQQINEEREARLLTKWRAERIQKNIAQGGAKKL